MARLGRDHVPVLCFAQGPDHLNKVHVHMYGVLSATRCQHYYDCHASPLFLIMESSLFQH